MIYTMYTGDKTMDLLQQILPLVKKPARYAGGEWNAVHKDWDNTEIKVVLPFLMFMR